MHRETNPEILSSKFIYMHVGLILKRKYNILCIYNKLIPNTLLGEHLHHHSWKEQCTSDKPVNSEVIW